jgi:uncharacterized protein (TIGR00297 family)
VNQVPSWMVGLLLATIIALLARHARALSSSGALAAAATGTLAMAAGWNWGVLLIAYFVSATLLSRHRGTEKIARTGGRIEKGGERDALQVMANGGLFALCAVGFRLSPDALWQALGAAALAASAADTWSTEIGTLADAPPRSILDWATVDVGTSGGVTTQGLLAGFAGAAFMAILTMLVRWPIVATAAALVGGAFGCVLDSVLGASLQARRWCATCETATEQRIHRCGTSTTVTGGLRWLDNDGVNAISTIGGALFGATSARYFY